MFSFTVILNTIANAIYCTYYVLNLIELSFGSVALSFGIIP